MTLETLLEIFRTHAEAKDALAAANNRYQESFARLQEALLELEAQARESALPENVRKLFLTSAVGRD